MGVLVAVVLVRVAPRSVFGVLCARFTVDEVFEDIFFTAPPPGGARRVRGMKGPLHPHTAGVSFSPTDERSEEGGQPPSTARSAVRGAEKLTPLRPLAYTHAVGEGVRR